MEIRPYNRSRRKSGQHMPERIKEVLEDYPTPLSSKQIRNLAGIDATSHYVSNMMRQMDGYEYHDKKWHRE